MWVKSCQLVSQTRTRTATLCVLCLVGALYIIAFSESSSRPIGFQSRMQPFSSGVTALTDRATKQKERIRHMREACTKPTRDEQLRIYNEKYPFLKKRESLYYYPKFDLLYCKVPKVGCTFLVEMFQILQSGDSERASKYSALSRSAIHAQTYSNRIKDNDTSLPTVFAARDPYSRLYSAYVDKILLPNKYRISRKIQDQLNKDNGLENITDKCANDVTFQQFLDSIITTAKSNKRMNFHWAPITTICTPCSIENYMLIKQESFTDDIEDFLRSLNVSDNMYDNITAIMTSKRIESTIPGIVKVVLKRAYALEQCLSYLQILEKLWQSFQIQGYISEHRTFPSRKLNRKVGNNYSVDYFSDVMVRAARRSKLTSIQSKAQRNAYLVRAFANISNATLKEIIQIYSPDFQLFDYSIKPPA